MPLNNHVPDSEPITNKISIAPIAELMLLTMLVSISSQLQPSRQEIIPATDAAKNNAIWLGPSVACDPNKTTLMESKATSEKIGTNACSSEGLDVLVMKNN
jgi:hypothetical protein